MNDLLNIASRMFSFLPITHTPLLIDILSFFFKNSQKPLIPTYIFLKNLLIFSIGISTLNFNFFWFILFKYFLDCKHTNLPLYFHLSNFREALEKFSSSLTSIISCMSFIISINQLYFGNFIFSIVCLTFSNYLKFYGIFLFCLITKCLYDLSKKKEKSLKTGFMFFLFFCSLIIYFMTLKQIIELPYFDLDKSRNIALLKQIGFSNAVIKSIKKRKNFNKEFTNEFKQTTTIDTPSYEIVLDRSEVTLKSNLGYVSLINKANNIFGYTTDGMIVENDLSDEETSEIESDETFEKRTNKRQLERQIAKLERKYAYKNSDSETSKESSDEIENIQFEISQLKEKLLKLAKITRKTPFNNIKISKQPSIFKITKLHNHVYNNFYQKAYRELFIRNGDEIKISFKDKNLTVRNSEKRFSSVKFIKNSTNKDNRFIVETINNNDIFSMRTYFRLKNSGKYLSVKSSTDELKLSFYGKKSHTIFSIEKNKINNIFNHHKFNKIVNYRTLNRKEKLIELIRNIFLNNNVRDSMYFLKNDWVLIIFNIYFVFRFVFQNLINIRYYNQSLSKRDWMNCMISLLFLLNIGDENFYLLGAWILKEFGAQEIILLSVFFSAFLVE
ncbi:hypothetical protein CDIK_1225 [Cucumispora dikerogammari]|nr:hypothetical protein CDIK_1225 [Cucumispora dikerogammari]